MAMPQMGPVVKTILIVCAVLFLGQLVLQSAFDINLSLYLGFVPARLVDFWLWQPFTYCFLHAGPIHLLFNLLVIWSMGSELEIRWGSRAFLLYFFASALGGAILYGLFAWLGIAALGSNYPVIGSSAAVYGLLMAYGLLFGDRILYFFLLFPMPAKYFVLILGGMELISSLFYSNSGIAHMAHLGGMITGFFVLLAMAAWNRRSKNEGGKKRKLRKSSHLRLVNTLDEEDEPSDPRRWH
jgi:membrane associated rhomboid family serine protease